MGFRLLIEDGSALLIEDGASVLLLEDAGAGGGELPASLRAAIKARWDELGLAATVGELRSNRLQAGEASPYCLLLIRRGGLDRKSSTSQADDVRAAFRVVAAGVADARARATIVDASFRDVGLSWDGGVACPAVRTNRTDGEEKGLGAGNRPVFYDLVEMQYRTFR